MGLSAALATTVKLAWGRVRVKARGPPIARRRASGYYAANQERNMQKPLIAVAADTRFHDGYTWHGSPQTYLEAAVDVAGTTPLLVPAFGGRIDLDMVLDAVHGVLATGSKTNVHPSHYSVAPSAAHEPYDEARDATSIPLLRRAIERGIPVLAICRGFQELNVAFGGSIASEIQELTGKMDHRAATSANQAERFKIHQDVFVREGSCLASIIDAGAVKVNSLHRQAVERLGAGLEVEAVAADGTIEAVSVNGAKAFAVGVQWHPEYWAKSDAPSGKILKAFGDAVRLHAKAKAFAQAAE
jgi:putative glutamine amidotransferase